MFRNVLSTKVMMAVLAVLLLVLVGFYEAIVSATTGYFSFQEPIDTPVPAELNGIPAVLVSG